MATYQCKKCNEQLEIHKRTLVLREGKLVCKEAKCKCGEWMDQVITEEYNGLPDIQRNEGSDGAFKRNLTN
tara:strand:- start:295 stop:507 length:213 start_codon:yes stop_codon:yes gene_type:complete